MQWHTGECRVCDVSLPVRDGEKEPQLSAGKERDPGCGDVETKEELIYSFLCNCKKTEVAGERSKEEESSRDEKNEAGRMLTYRNTFGRTTNIAARVLANGSSLRSRAKLIKEQELRSLHTVLNFYYRNARRFL